MSRAKMMVIVFVISYGAPLLIAVITVASSAGQENYIFRRNACWLNWYESKALLGFVIPAFTIVAINLMVLIVVLYKICVAILTPIFGLTWGFGIGTMVSQDLGIHVVFALLNSLQGFFILVFGIIILLKLFKSHSVLLKCFNPFCHILLQIQALAGRLSLSNLTSSNHIRVNTNKTMNMIHEIFLMICSVDNSSAQLIS
uniref:G-protein coupled receptors family 2 profile 2 domain-containing protein n=1 Tax=Cyprinus carpio TaxID=7962 RepID=A0A8C2GTF0_CYPCA